MKARLAQLTSGIINPFLVSFLLILLLSFSSAGTVSEALKWALILTGISILPVLAVIIYLVRNDRIEGIFINMRRQRHKIFALAGICTVIGCALLIYLSAPLVLIAAYVSTLVSTVVFMLINFFWKISLHAAFTSGSVAVLTILFGTLGAFTAVLLPAVGWARIELKHHSFAQVTAGSVLAAAIVVVVFHFFGLIGSAPV